jgi:hypothetical protein
MITIPSVIYLQYLNYLKAAKTAADVQHVLNLLDHSKGMPNEEGPQ